MSQLTLEATIVALLRIAVDEREERIAADPTAKKTEILLEEAGLTYAQIGEATGKNPDAVRMVINRATAAKPARSKSRRKATDS